MFNQYCGTVDAEENSKNIKDNLIMCTHPLFEKYITVASIHWNRRNLSPAHRFCLFCDIWCFFDYSTGYCRGGSASSFSLRFCGKEQCIGFFRLKWQCWWFCSIGLTPFFTGCRIWKCGGLRLSWLGLMRYFFCWFVLLLILWDKSRLRLSWKEWTIFVDCRCCWNYVPLRFSPPHLVKFFFF